MPQSISPVFIGFNTLEELLAAVSPCGPLFVARSGNSDRLFEEHHVSAASVSHGVCLYWRMLAAAVPLVGPLRPAEVDLELRVESLLFGVQHAARQRRLRVEAALVAFPNDVALITGDTRLIEFSHEAGLFFYR
ncbi:MAG: hypothetical protein KF778_23205, partial [Rhodocyclaceae bacterium]|nr:hypothetical protein [Rhodocyclaceae bacterium]